VDGNRIANRNVRECDECCRIHVCRRSYPADERFSSNSLNPHRVASGIPVLGWPPHVRHLCYSRCSLLTRKILLGSALALVFVVGLYIRFHHSTVPLEIAYAGNKQTTVWSTSAQVREPIGIISFGERLDVLQRFQDQVKIRSPRGQVGWVPEHDLLSADLWQMMKDLDIKAAGMTVEARGHTRVLSNLHFGPGRDTPRVRQLNKDVPLELLTRQPAEINPSLPAAGANGSRGTEQESAGQAPGAKKEDWWLVRAHTVDQGILAGWLLSRFIDLDVPAPLPDYASSAGMRIVAWDVLNEVNDPSGKRKPQYLLLGTHGPEGQACDFTSMRGYTWSLKHQSYETAFVESNVCGKLPIQITRASASGGDVTFSFEDLSGPARENREYLMRQTIIRRVRGPGEVAAHKHSR
jgi:hypothetical protein